MVLDRMSKKNILRWTKQRPLSAGFYLKGMKGLKWKTRVYIKKLILKNYRNYREQEIAFDDGITILWGKNAQGKTNALEAIFLLSAGRSHRNPREKELIYENEKYARVFAEIIQENGIHTVEIILSRTERKRILVNGIPVSRVGEMFGHLCTVMFSPEDLSLIKDGPAERRRFIDFVLSQAGKKYFYDLQKYINVLEERNSLLKSLDPKNINTLDVWDEQLINAALPIINTRRNFCKKLTQKAKEIHYIISGKKEVLEAEYLSGATDMNKDVLAGMKEKLVQNRKKDTALGYTSIGPHRDDIKLKVDGVELKSYGSQGQQRTAALSLKLAEIDILSNIIGEKPILLLDDVFSELDMSRQKYLVEKLKDIQAIITCTGKDVSFFKEATLLNVIAGSIR